MRQKPHVQAAFQEKVCAQTREKVCAQTREKVCAQVYYIRSIYSYKSKYTKRLVYCRYRKQSITFRALALRQRENMNTD